jgi:SNW domain-containing protein 1
MVEAQVDPMEPPKHKHSKVPKGSSSPPVPILHSPPRKLTVEDQQAWKIPPCISNWKNARGFVIPLDKRLAADGRGLEEVTINNKFAMLSESLYIAERKAVQDLNVRNELRKNIALREKEEREQSLREMANRARMERTGTYKPEVDDKQPQNRDSDDDHSDVESVVSIEETEEDRIARQQRDRLRLDRRKENERQMRFDNMKVSEHFFVFTCDVVSNLVIGSRETCAKTN